jgi:hypothetical protein
MKREMEEASAKGKTRIDPALHVEIRVREETKDAISERDVASAQSTQSWVVRLAVLVAVLAIAGIYVGAHIGSGWVPADDGTLSQSALRVLQGQLPHRDFAEIYTGGLSMIHALAFRAFGVNLMSLRICAFLFFLAWIPAVYYVALRFTSALPAGLITLVAVAWSYPNYPAAMPSWYNLFFATFGAAAMLRYLEIRKARWLFVAGVCGGVSILIKVIGAYYIAGILLFLAFLEQSESSKESSEKNSEASSQASPALEPLMLGWPYRVFSLIALLLFLATLVHVLGARLGTSELYQFVLPSAAIVLLILSGEQRVQVEASQRFRRIFQGLIPFLGGLAFPIVIYLLPYARSGMVARFLFGVTSSAIARSIDLGVIRPVGLEQIMWVLPLVAILAAAMYWDKFQSKAVGAALGFAAVAIVVRATQSPETVSGIWCSVALLTPITVLLGALLVWSRRNEDPDRDENTQLQRQQIVLLISLAATCSLVQFPFAAPIYLSYAAPLTLLALVAVVSTGKTKAHFGNYALPTVLGFYLLFGVVNLVPRYIYELTYKVGRMDTMQSRRAGGLKIDGAKFFDDLSSFLRNHSPNGLMFAGNDCPELYFLSGLRNVISDDGGASPEEILKAVRSDNLNLVVINDSPYFPSSAMAPEVRAEVMKNFPHNTRFGSFEVFWKR